MSKDVENQILIGSKPVEDYLIIAARMLRNYNEVFIMARGRNISRAVEVLERLKKELYGLKYQIETGTEIFQGSDGRPKHVSFIRIRVYRERGDIFVPRLSRLPTLRG